ncbi:AMCI inhibitor, partial [Pseudoatta argentina]
MSRASFVLFVMIGVLCSTTIAQRCGRNQEWNTCGSACPPSCDSSPNQFCTLQCVIGCQCKRGYVLNSSGECVHPSQYAAPNCGQNEYFNSCGSSCQPTCQNPTPQICTLACVTGCECMDGYVRNAENQCIPAYNC